LLWSIDNCYYFRVGDSTYVSSSSLAVTPAKDVERLPGVVRLTHWITTVSFFALLVSGMAIVISHPRFYWGETGSVLTPALFQIPIPASRSGVPTGYNFMVRDMNGWGRYLHFEAAWVALFTGLVYLIFSLYTKHLRRNLLPRASELSWRSLLVEVRNHLRFKPRNDSSVGSYNVLQRLTYLMVIFVLFPLIIWTGLAMSPAIVSAFPVVVTIFRGQESARTIHFFVSGALVIFLVVHIAMIRITGFRARMRGMILGSPEIHKERP
jgi:thiosulfate reductase cytochrome b subunit